MKTFIFAEVYAVQNNLKLKTTPVVTVLIEEDNDDIFIHLLGKDFEPIEIKSNKHGVNWLAPNSLFHKTFSQVVSDLYCIYDETIRLEIRLCEAKWDDSHFVKLFPAHKPPFALPPVPDKIVDERKAYFDKFFKDMDKKDDGLTD